MDSSRAQLAFPKQFRKTHFDSLDWRFYIIVLISLIFHVALILFIKARIPSTYQSKTISEIQQRYVNFFLERDQTVTEELELQQPTGETGDVLLAPSGGGGVPGAREGAAEGPGVFLTPEERLPEAGEMADAARGGGGGGGRPSQTLSDVADKVGNVGFLGLLTSGTGYVAEEYVSGIDSYGEAENSRLGETLSSLDAVRVSKGPEGKGWGGTDGKGNYTGPTGKRVVRGTRTENRAMSIDQLIGELQPTGSVDFEDIDRSSTSYEKVASTVQQKPDIPTTQEEKERLRRKPEHVQSVINGHRLAITDCYKQVLKTKPGVKGKVEVRFAINPEGAVSWVELINSTIKSEKLENCILNRISQWNDFGYGDPTSPDEVYRQTFTLGY